MQLTWRPRGELLQHELTRVEAHYERALAKIMAIVRGGFPDGEAVLARLKEEGHLLHPYVVEWFNRQRSNLENNRELIFPTFEELPELEGRIRDSETRRRETSRSWGMPFDLNTRSATIPHAARHLRDIADEAYGDEFAVVDLMHDPPVEILEVTAEAWKVLSSVWPEAADEISNTTRTISYFTNDFLVGGALQSFLGGIFLTRRRATTPIQLAEEILHESSHTMLFYMMIDRELWSNDPAARYETILRKDTRPFWGLFHQLFVLTRLSEYYRRVSETTPDCRANYDEVVSQVRRGLEVVEEIGELEAEGRILFDAIREHAAELPTAA